jgi:hypothetical protein
MKHLKNYNTFILEKLNFRDKLLTTLLGLDIPDFCDDYFDCSDNILTSLEGCPIEVVSFFDCSDNSLTTLKGSPTKVGTNFNCHKNNLTSLEYCPKYVGGSFECTNNKLTILDYLPEYIGGDLFCFDNEWIKPIPYEIMVKYNLHPTETNITDVQHVYTKQQFIKFSSFEFQKEFLEREPENYLDLKPFGYAKGLEDIFPHLFDMDELGLID